MNYLSKNACLLALFALFLAGPLGRAADPELDGDLRKELTALKKQLESLRQAQEIESKIQETRFKLIDRRLDRIEKSLKRLEQSSPVQSSSFKPVAQEPALPIVATGTLMLTNRLYVPASVTVNGVTYTVPARTTRTLSSVPAGAVNYSVAAAGWVRPAVRTPLAVGEELTLTIY